MAGANRGKPKPASDRRHDVAASAIIYNNNKLECVIKIKIYGNVPEAACKVKASMT